MDFSLHKSDGNILLNYSFRIFQPKLNERDIEREKLRKENQLLRDRLNSLHEREQSAQSED